MARQGYVSLLVGSRPPGTADSAEMVAARDAFLSAGHFAPLESALAEAVWSAHAESFSHSPDDGRAKAYGGSGHGAEPVIADAERGHRPLLGGRPRRGGTRRRDGVRRVQARRAAGRQGAPQSGGAFVADVWRRLPIGDGVADVVMNVFAPRNGPEFRRILRPGGRVVVVTPAPGHLSPLVKELGLLSVDAWQGAAGGAEPGGVRRGGAAGGGVRHGARA
ncbi:hypothetical protein ACFSTC_55990 [Nonomuraea ferruginea]